MTDTNNAVILSNHSGIRELIKEHLKSKNINILSSGGYGNQALEILTPESSRCQLIVGDIQLNDMLFAKFLEKVRQMPDFDQTLIFVLASPEESIELEKCLKLGICGIILKPVTTSEAFAEKLKMLYLRLKHLNGNFKALFLNTMATFSENQGHIKAAIQYHKESLNEYEAGISHFDIGRLNLKLQNKEIALPHFKKAEEINPNLKSTIEKIIQNYEATYTSKITDVELKLFMQPLDQFSTSFYNSNQIKKVLVLGSEHNTRITLKTILGQLSIKDVLLYEDPNEALKYMSNVNVDLIITWFDFLNGNAENLALTVRKQYNSTQTKILVIVNDQQILEVGRPIVAGADGYLIIPFTKDILCQRLHRMMILHELTSQSKESEHDAKAAYLSYEVGNCIAGETFAEKGFIKNPKDYVCELFLAMNMHMQRKNKDADKHYSSAMSHFSVLFEMTRYYMNLIAQALNKREETEKKLKSESPIQGQSAPENNKTSPVAKMENPPMNLKKIDQTRELNMIHPIKNDILSLDKNAKKLGYIEPLNENVQMSDLNDAETPPILVELKRTQLPLKLFGEFPELQSLQKRIFGKVEEDVSLSSIPRTAYDFGISDSNCIQQLAIEQVFGGMTTYHQRLSHGRIRQLEDVTLPWMPTEVISAIKPDNLSANDILLLTNQVQLLNSRIISLSCSKKESQNLNDYALALQDVVFKVDIINSLKIENLVDNQTKLLHDLSIQDSSNKEKLVTLGKNMVRTSLADSIFIELTNISLDEANKKMLQELFTPLQQPLVKFHEECLNGKKEFEKQLPSLLETIANKKQDLELLTKAMEIDHNNIESFKKIYIALKKSGQLEFLDKFVKELQPNYLKNRKSLRALNRFFLSEEDHERAKNNIVNAFKHDNADPDGMMSMTYLCYRMKDYERTIACCLEMIRRDLYLVYAYNLLAVSYKNTNRLDQAIATYEKGIEVEPNSIKLNNNLSVAYALSGNVAMAKRLKEKTKSLLEEMA